MARVWAPNAETVELVIGEKTWPMQRTTEGWWRSPDRPLQPGDDYKFRLNGEATYPDPRSPWQPFGVNGPSRHLDHSDFVWHDEHWQARPLSAAVIYEIHIGTFTPEGTFLSAIARLDHLKDLGISHIEIMPVAEFLGDFGWGYDGVFPFAPQHSYGTPNDLKTLVNACHQKGIGVLLDVVYNHLGPSGNCLANYGPYFSKRHTTGWGDAINFDGPYSDEVRRYFCDNALTWLRDYHFDGLRLDAVHAIVDTSAVPFLEQLATEVDALKAHLGRHLVLIAESDLNDPRVVRHWELGGYGFDAQWSDDIHHSVHSVLTGEREGYYSDFGSLDDLVVAMTRPFVYAGRHSTYRLRTHGRQPLGMSASKFIAFSQNHDQLGNRACGDRLSTLTSKDLVKVGAALILLSPYVPMLFQGEEWGTQSPFQYFVDFQTEPDLAKAVAEGRQKEFASFGWKPDEMPDPNSIETFQRSKLDWSEVSQECYQEILDWYKALIRLRSQVSAFTDGRLDMVCADADVAESWIRIQRGPILMACNFSDKQRTISFMEQGRHHTMLIASKPPVETSAVAVTVLPEAVAVFYNNDWNQPSV